MEYKINPALIPSKCRRCLNFTGAYCDIHQHFIEDAANCSEFTDGENSQEDTRITVGHLREILGRCVEAGYINEHSKHRILDIVKKET